MAFIRNLGMFGKRLVILGAALIMAA